MKFFILSLFSLLLISCSSSRETIQKQTKPTWLYNPQINDKLAAVGCASIHINGIHAQKQLAIARAIEQLVLQKSAKVKVVAYRKNTASSTSKRSTFKQTSSLQESNTTIQTLVKDFYTNSDKEICAWVQEK